MPHRRLGDHIVHAMNLALDHGELEVAEHLNKALELCMTAVGGRDRTDAGTLPGGWESALMRLGALRHERPEPPAGPC